MIMRMTYMLMRISQEVFVKLVGELVRPSVMAKLIPAINSVQTDPTPPVPTREDIQLPAKRQRQRRVRSANRIEDGLSI